MKRLFHRPRLLHLLFLAALSSPVFAETRYVDAVHGSNANTGTSWSDAWQTISHAVSSTGGSALIDIAPGLYDSSLGESFPIDIGWRTLRGVAGPAATILDGGGVGSELLKSYSGVDWGTTLQGLWLRDADQGLWIVREYSAGSAFPQVYLRDIVISDMASDGVYARVRTDWDDCGMRIVMDRTVIERCGRALLFWLLCDPNHPTDPPMTYGWFTCRDSLIRNNGGGLTCWADDNTQMELLRVEGCTIADNGGTPIESSAWGWPNSPATIQLRNSILWGTGTMAGPTDVLYSNTEHVLYPGLGNLSEDPFFNDPTAGDHRLRFGSPCADAGHSSFSHGLDLQWTPRPLDGDLDTVEGPDMGAYELAPLAFHGEARIGTTVDLEFWGPPAGTSTLYWIRGTPSPPITTPYGAYELGLERRTFAVVGTAPGPPIVFPLSIPANTVLIGQSFTFQGLSTSGTSAWPPVAFTNAVTLTVVP